MTPQKILLVEDDPVLIRVYARLVKKSGYETLTLEDGLKVLAVSKAEKPNLIVLDLIMPEKNGFEVIAEVKADPETKNIPILVVSRLTMPADIAKAKSLGAEYYFQKVNYTFDDILKVIKKILN